MIDTQLPFIDLHRHLEGCVRLETMLALAEQHSLQLPGNTVDALHPHVVLAGPQADLVGFLDRLKWMIFVLRDPDACRRIAYECVQDSAAEGLDYLELRFSPLFMAQPHGLNPADVTAAVIDGAKAAERDFGLTTRLIGIMSRTFGPESCLAELEALLEHRHELRALDLAGDEARWPGELYYEHFKRGRDAGWQVTVHAGEAGGAANVRYAIEHLGATRIGHGIRAIDDPSLIELIAHRGIGLEVNLTSNLQTNTVQTLTTHPLASFLQNNLLASINTDDPIISGIDLHYEFHEAAPTAGITPALAKRAQENALATAFLSPSERQTILQRKAAKQSPTP
ncbi:adenosine deaminase [Verrucomicrobiia bacterium DG1235]|nr:adenosine deaminase [Verrucomicrobiae bacterium DG1235]